MRFTPLANSPNVSRTRSDSISPSMQIDSRGFPNIVWLEEKLGHNELQYTFWDGLQWAYNSYPFIRKSEEQIVNTSNSLILDIDDRPQIAFSKNSIGVGSVLTVAEPYHGEWLTNSLEVDYSVSWIGIEKAGRGIEFSSSSTSSFAYSSSSSSSSSYSSESSSTSSSSSIDSPSSSSSSSFEDTLYVYSIGATISPDATGIYYWNGLYNGYGSWIRNDGAYVLWYGGTGRYYISITYNSLTNYFQNAIAGNHPISTHYIGHAGYTGTAGVTYVKPSSSSSSSKDSSSSSSRSSNSSSSFSSNSSSSSSSSSKDSSSSGSSSSSSSIDSSSSSSSSSSNSSSSSSSNSSSSSSSSIDSSSSSSSSSKDDSKKFVVAYDISNVIHVYSVTDSVWRLLNEITVSITDIPSIKIASCGKKIGITYRNNQSQIMWNFIDVDSQEWSFPIFQVLSRTPGNNTVVTFDIDGYSEEDDGILAIAWIESNNLGVTIKYVAQKSTGLISYLGGRDTIWFNSKSVQTLNYMSNGFTSVGVALDSTFAPIVFVGGFENRYFKFNGSTWYTEQVDMEGCIDGIVIQNLGLKLHEDSVRIVFTNGDIYFFGQSDVDGFEISKPNLALYTSDKMFLASWKSGSSGVMKGTNIENTQTNRAGDVLKESLKKVAVVVNDKPYYGWTISTNTGTHNWINVDCSADGSKVVATKSNEYIYTSNDYGATWTQQTASGARTWIYVRCSADASFLIATAQVNSYIYTSNDFGATWNARATLKFWTGLACSADGKHCAAAAESDKIWLSNDYGITWVASGSPSLTNWQAVTISDDGTKLAAAGNNSIFTSSDSGATWIQQPQTIGKNFVDISGSSDGSRLAAIVYNGYIYISSDFGFNWTPAASIKPWVSICTDADNSQVVGLTGDGAIWTSFDFGVTWELETPVAYPPTFLFGGIAVSSDDTHMIATRGKTSASGVRYLSIDSIDLKSQSEISYRSASIEGLVIQSVNIHQSEGYFVTSQPLENNGQIVIYPQSPNNPNYETKTYNEFSGYGSLYFPLDARYDFARNKLWIADAGNQKVVKLDSGQYRYELSIGGLTLPHSIAPEINLGGVFVKTFSGINTGTVYYYDKTGSLQEYFSYPANLGYPTTDIILSDTYVKSLPLPSTMVYDHVRWRVWWVSKSVVYMADLRNNQVSSFDLSPSYTNTRSIEVEYNTGYAYVVARGYHNNWVIVEIFRDNNRVLDWAYAPLGT